MGTKKFILMFSLLASTAVCFGQDADCDVKSILQSDGSMYYYQALDTFYYTKSKMLMGGMVTDKENYFLVLTVPGPDKIEKLKDYKPLSVELNNDSTYSLPFFDARFLKDSVFILFYLFDKKKLKDFLTIPVKSVSIITPFFQDSFVFQLHKGAIIKHLNCLSVKRNKL